MALLVLALAFGPSSALAKEFKFDACPSGSLGGQCNDVRGIAVNQNGAGGVAAGTIYVADNGNNRIQSFDADGNFIRLWGWDVVEGGGTGFEICEVAASCKAGTKGGAAGQFNVIAGGVAVNQSTGDVYVIDRSNVRVQQFTATGTFIRTWGADVDLAPGADFEICEVPANCKQGIAGTGAGMFGATSALVGMGADSSGNLYVADAANFRVQKFEADGSFLRLAGWDVIDTGPGDDITAPEDQYEVCVPADGDVCKVGEPGEAECQFRGTNPSHLAVSPAGDTYAADTSNKAIYRLTSALACVGPVGSSALEGEEPRAIAVNPADGHLFISKRFDQNIYEVDPDTGAIIEVTPVGAANRNGLVVNGSSGRMYTTGSTSGGNWIRAFDPGFSVTTFEASNVTAISARLNGTVNPAGEAVSECKFEYGTTEAYGQSAECVPNAAGVGSGSAPVAVHADIGGLQPGTTYHFRLVAVSAGDAGEVQGQNKSFPTLGAAIEATWAEDVGLNEATLKAEINPKGKATTYRFEYGTQGPCSANPCTSIPVPDGEVGADSTAHEVSAILDGLEAGTTYHYRVVAANSDGVSEGPDLAFTTYRPLVPETECPNQVFRIGPSASLPDCRAYEMVSPPDKGGGDIVAPSSDEQGREAAFRQASIDGERITYSSTTAFANAQRAAASNQYLATRGPGGWSTNALYPPQGTTVFDPEFEPSFELQTAVQAFTPDLCFTLMMDNNLVPLTPDGIPGHTNLYLRDNCGPGAGTYRALTVGDPPTYSQSGEDLFLQARAFSGDLSHIIYSATAALDSTPPPCGAEVPDAPQIYDFAGGELRLVSVLPSGEANCAASYLGSAPSGGGGLRVHPGGGANISGAVSEDGSRIFWTAFDGDRTVYLRVDGAETLQVSGTGDAEFWAASPDGSKAIFGEGTDLFEFDVEKALAEEPGATIPIGGEVGGVAGASEDLSHLYFTSEEDLAAGASVGEPNLYLRRDGDVRLVASAQGAIQIDDFLTIGRHTRVSLDGQHLAFMSSASLTGFDNADAETGEAVAEVYLYDAQANGGTGELVCASCNPTGARPQAEKPIEFYKRPPGRANFLAAAWLPPAEWTSYSNRPLSDGGNRLFFNAFDALVPEDTNDAQDVYQWEAPGTGSCDAGDPRYFAENGGCLSLISTGKSSADSVFLDASANGRDVFFTTASNIDPRDLGFIDLYDGREGGGFPPPPPPTPECAGDACQSVPAPPSAQTPASASFRGPGDAKPQAGKRRRCAKGKRKVRRGGKARCVAKQGRKRAANRKGRNSR